MVLKTDDKTIDPLLGDGAIPPSEAGEKENSMSLTREKKAEIEKKYGQSETDTGSAAVQIALLTERIRGLTEHLNVHRKDFSSQWGLRKMVGQRRRLMKYMKKHGLAAYKELIQSLGIRGV